MHLIKEQNWNNIVVVYKTDKGAFVKSSSTKIVPHEKQRHEVEAGFGVVTSITKNLPNGMKIGYIKNIETIEENTRKVSHYKGYTMPSKIFKGKFFGNTVYKEYVGGKWIIVCYFADGSIKREFEYLGKHGKEGKNRHFLYIDSNVEEWVQLDNWEDTFFNELTNILCNTKSGNQLEVSELLEKVNLEYVEEQEGIYLAKGKHATLVVTSNGVTFDSIWIPNCFDHLLFTCLQVSKLAKVDLLQEV